MTPETINQMEAGEELDTLVAEKIMGWKLEPERLIHGYLMHGIVKSRAWEGSTKNDITQTKESWHPSTDIAAAWRVVEKLGAIVLSYDGELECLVTIKGAAARANTASLAICRAALKTLSIDGSVR